MNNYLSLTKEQQQKVLQAAENKIGLPGQAIEKDNLNDKGEIHEKRYVNP